jgi:4-hydroxythreonine-4-phosphate dehydrogenase
VSPGSEHLATPTIVLSSGEPAGIGPDICLALAREALGLRIGVLADRELLAQRADALGWPIELVTVEVEDLATLEPQQPGRLNVLPTPLACPVVAGRLDARNAGYVLELLRRGVELCRTGASQALVTAPVQKSIINEAGIAFSGHTEFLAELTASGPPVMLLAGKALRVALATTHLPLRNVAASLTSAGLEHTLGVLHRDLEQRFGITAPRILVLGLNPHAGERGVLGDEEQRIIEPALERARRQGLKVLGPAPADTAFNPASLERCDVVLAMYHDQGLPVLKALEFGRIVNVTLGLPIVRTSVDHGTALELAGTGRADHASLRQAVAMAAELAARS